MSLEGLSLVNGTLAGKYRLIRKIGQGGMGAVYEAMHLRLGQRVAAKVMLPELAQRSETAYRFEYEARASAKLRGRHTVRVLDVDTSPEGLHYLVMEFLEGRNLRDELIRCGPLPVGDAVRYVREACEGVDEAHRVGIVHRDIKPANLFLSVEGETQLIKVIDFGIAKAMSPTDINVQTASNTPLGTYLYMSPEQAKSARSVDARTDVWALGVVLYQLLAGKTPFEGEGALGIVYAIATQVPPPLRAVRPDVPESLVTTIKRALCKDPADRYPTVRALSDALAPFESRHTSLVLHSPILPATSTPDPGCDISTREFAYAPTQALAPTGEHLRSKSQIGPHERLSVRPAASAKAPDESATTGSKSHVVPLRSMPLRGVSLAQSLGLFLGSIVMLLGGIIMIAMRTSTHPRPDAAPPTLAATSEGMPAFKQISPTTILPTASDRVALPPPNTIAGAAGRSTVEAMSKEASAAAPSSLAVSTSAPRFYQIKARQSDPVKGPGPQMRTSSAPSALPPPASASTDGRFQPPTLRDLERPFDLRRRKYLDIRPINTTAGVLLNHGRSGPWSRGGLTEFYASRRDAAPSAQAQPQAVRDEPDGRRVGSARDLRPGHPVQQAEQRDAEPPAAAG
jgi:eukaryotic-like serine/threonine-protein kinase